MQNRVIHRIVTKSMHGFVQWKRCVKLHQKYSKIAGFAGRYLPFSILLFAIDGPVCKIHVILSQIPQDVFPPQWLRIRSKLSHPHWCGNLSWQQKSPSEIQFFGEGFVVPKVIPNSQQGATHDQQQSYKCTAFSFASLTLLWHITTLPVFQRLIINNLTLISGEKWKFHLLRHHSGVGPLCYANEYSPGPKYKTRQSTCRCQDHSKHCHVVTHEVTPLDEVWKNFQTKCAKRCKHSGHRKFDPRITSAATTAELLAAGLKLRGISCFKLSWSRSTLEESRKIS